MSVASVPAHEGPVRVLVVDDSAFRRAYLHDWLEEHDFAVTVAEDGRLALEYLQWIGPAELPDFILSDVSMPNLDGVGLVQALKANPTWARIPVVLYTADKARMTAQAEAAGRDAGAMQYLKVALEFDTILDELWKVFETTEIRQHLKE